MVIAEPIHKATDLHEPIDRIKSQYKDGTIKRLIHIQDAYQLEDVKSLDWIAKLKCFSPHASRKRPREQVGNEPAHSKVLRRKIINGCNDSLDFVAVSYPWEAATSPPSSDNPDAGAWCIEATPNSRKKKPSSVRDIVLDRATTYAKSCDSPDSAIWIDKESIPQKDCFEKQTAMQSMDLVYRFSKYPVALLFTTINTREEIDLLRDLLCLEDIDKLALAQRSALLQLLGRITSDPWWERAWTFQEDYCAGSKMTLLIPHGPRLFKDFRVFGRIRGELQIQSAEFRNAATRFCLDYRNSYLKMHSSNAVEAALCKDILQKAGKYTILLDCSVGYQEYNKTMLVPRYRKSMSVRIFQDVASKRATVPSDFLAIIANCCNYSVRLDTTAIKDEKCSLGLSLLALYFLNGEIFKNDQSSPLADTARLDTLEYLDHISLDSFDCLPRRYRLSFLKYCRFVNPRLTPTGVVTSGILWHLTHAIRTDSPTSAFRTVWQHDKQYDATGDGPLDQLVHELRRHGFRYLAYRLDRFLREERNLPSGFYMDVMAAGVAAAIEEGKTLVVGKRMGVRGREAYSGIFVASDDGDTRHQPRRRYDSHAFTGWEWAGRDPVAAVEETKLDRFVSLEVGLDRVGSRQPVLRTKRWMNGLVFWKQDDIEDVLFPWPPGLTVR